MKKKEKKERTAMITRAQRPTSALMPPLKGSRHVKLVYAPLQLASLVVVTKHAVGLLAHAAPTFGR